MTAYNQMVEEAGELKGLEAYSASRPPHSEGLAVTIASYLAYELSCPRSICCTCHLKRRSRPP